LNKGGEEIVTVISDYKDGGTLKKLRKRGKGSEARLNMT